MHKPSVRTSHGHPREFSGSSEPPLPDGRTALPAVRAQIGFLNICSLFVFDCAPLFEPTSDRCFGLCAIITSEVVTVVLRLGNVRLMRHKKRVTISVMNASFAVLAFLPTPTTWCAVEAKKPFTVADEIRLTTFGHPNAERTPAAQFSPDGKYLLVVAERGRLHLNQ